MSEQQQEQLVYSSVLWKIYRQDAGMGEYDYAVFLDGVFYCRTEDSQTAQKIVEAIRSRPHTPAPAITEDDLVKEISDAFDRGYKVGFTEGQTDGTENEKLRVPDIARKAREDVLSVILDCAETDGEWFRIDGTDTLYLNYSVLSKKAESLRSTQQQAGDQHD